MLQRIRRFLNIKTKQEIEKERMELLRQLISQNHKKISSKKEIYKDVSEMFNFLNISKVNGQFGFIEKLKEQFPQVNFILIKDNNKYAIYCQDKATKEFYEILSSGEVNSLEARCALEKINLYSKLLSD
ncbi:MAG: hypothetical protein QW735_02735 [archaeon]